MSILSITCGAAFSASSSLSVSTPPSARSGLPPPRAPGNSLITLPACIFFIASFETITKIERLAVINVAEHDYAGRDLARERIGQLAPPVFAQAFDFADEDFQSVDLRDLIFGGAAPLREFQLQPFDLFLLIAQL